MRCVGQEKEGDQPYRDSHTAANQVEPTPASKSMNTAEAIVDRCLLDTVSCGQCMYA